MTFEERAASGHGNEASQGNGASGGDGTSGGNEATEGRGTGRARGAFGARGLFRPRRQDIPVNAANIAQAWQNHNAREEADLLARVEFGDRPVGEGALPVRVVVITMRTPIPMATVVRMETMDGTVRTEPTARMARMDMMAITRRTDKTATTIG